MTVLTCSASVQTLNFNYQRNALGPDQPNLKPVEELGLLRTSDRVRGIEGASIVQQLTESNNVSIGRHIYDSYVELSSSKDVICNSLSKISSLGH